MAAKTYMKAAEGFDIYLNGPIATSDYPWTVVDATRTATITPDAGAFPGAKALAFTGGTTSAVPGLQYSFPTELRAGYNTALATDRGVVGIGFWFNMNQMNSAVTSWLLQLGSSTQAGVYNLFGVTAAAVGSASMIFATNMNTPATAPVTYPIIANAYYWVDIRFAIDSTARTWNYEYRVNDVVIASGTATWTSVLIAAGNKMDRLGLLATQYLQWKMDDLVVRSACAADADWAGSTPTVVADISPMTSRRITIAAPVSNGTVNQWTSSNPGVPNYQAATDPTGAMYVSSTDIDQTDLYKFAAQGAAPSDISGVIYRGASPKLGSINPQFKGTSGVQTDMSPQSSGASRFVAVSESNEGVKWTAASIAAAEFGQKSI